MSKVSVITLTYQRNNFLREAIDCLRQQTMSDWEMIVIDNGNQTSTAELVKGYNDSRLRYFAQEFNRRIPAGRNEGLKYATGEYIFFLDDDDLLRADGLEQLVGAVEQSSDPTVAGAVSSTVILLDDGQTKTVEKIIAVNDGVAQYLWEVPMGYLGLFTRLAFQTVGGFDETLPSSEDIDWYIRFLDKFKLATIHQPVFSLRKHFTPRFTSFGVAVKPEVATNLARVIQKHYDLIKRYPTWLQAKIYRSVGINFLRASDNKTARDWLQRARDLQPNYIKGYLAVILTWLPRPLINWLLGLKLRV